MLRNPLALFGGVFIAYLLLSKTGDKVLEGFSVKKAKVINTSLTFEGVEIDIDLELQNDNVTGGTVNSFAGSLVWGGQVLSRVSFPNPVEIAAMGITNIPVLATIKFEEIADSLVSIVASGTWINDAKITGTLTMKNGVTIPVEKFLIRFG